MISVWFSKRCNDAIPFDRIICVDDPGLDHLSVVLEGKSVITIFEDETEDFMNAYKDFLKITEAISLGLIEEDEPKRKG